MCQILKCCVCDSEEFSSFYTFDYSQIGCKEPFHLKKCKGCGLVLNSPRLSLENIFNFYKEDYYVFNNETEIIYQEKARYDFNRVLSVSKPGDSLLEIGCARGHLLKLAKEKGYSVQGVEISAHASKITRESGIPVFTGRIEETAFDEKSFDIIVAFDVLEHVPDPLYFLKCVMKYLKKDGIFIIKTPNMSGIFAKIAKRRWIGFNPYHIYLFSPLNLKILCEKTKFNIVDLQTEKTQLFSFDGMRRLGIGSFCGAKIRGIAGTLLRRRVVQTSKISNDPYLNSKSIGFFERWIQHRMLGDIIVAYAKKSEWC